MKVQYVYCTSTKNKIPHKFHLQGPNQHPSERVLFWARCAFVQSWYLSQLVKPTVGGFFSWHRNFFQKTTQKCMYLLSNFRTFCIISVLCTHAFFLGERKTDLLRFEWAIIVTTYYFFSSFYTICAFSHEMFLNNKIMTQAFFCAAQGLLFKVPMSRISWLSTSKLTRFQRNFQNEIQC